MPATVPAENVLSALHWRYATKKFDASKKVPEPLFDQIMQAALAAPSSYGLQPWRFYVIADPAVRATLRPLSWNQPQVTDASHFVVFARRSTMTEKDVQRWTDRIIEVRSTPAAAVADYHKMMVGTVNSMSDADKSAWNARQVYIALGFAMAAAAMVGVDTCPMEGIDAAKYDAALKLPEQGYNATVALALGYRAADDMFAGFKKARFKAEEVIKRV
jgi:nitroreductase